MEAKSRDHES